MTYMTYAQRALRALGMNTDGKEVKMCIRDSNGPDLINSAGILAIHFMMGLCGKFEISCKKVLISMFLFLQIMGY